jgi:hypothetical protein
MKNTLKLISIQHTGLCYEHLHGQILIACEMRFMTPSFFRLDLPS